MQSKHTGFDQTFVSFHQLDSTSTIYDDWNVDDDDEDDDDDDDNDDNADDDDDDDDDLPI